MEPNEKQKPESVMRKIQLSMELLLVIKWTYYMTSTIKRARGILDHMM